MWYKNIRAQNLLILAISLAGILGSVYVFNLQFEINEEDRKQIQQTVYTTLVDYLTYHPKTEFDYIFLGLSGADPEPDIIDNFKTHITKVEPISVSRRSFGFSAPAVHIYESDKRGIQIDLESIDREMDGDVTVRTAIYQDRAADATYLFTLSKHQGQFQVNHVTFPDRPIF